MSEENATIRKAPGWAFALIGLGLSLMLLSGAGLILLGRAPRTVDAPLAAAQVDSSMMNPLMETVATVSPTPTATPLAQRPPVSDAPSSPTDDAAAVIAPTIPPAQPTLVPLPTNTSPPINWTVEEKNALTWMCYYEVGGMGSAKYDGCLSTISTVRARYAYSNSFPETDVIGTLLRPNQFNIEFDTQAPAPDPDLMVAVEQYAAGARGSCNGYLYFDSVPGGPSLCVIYGAVGQFIEFHNGWN